LRDAGHSCVYEPAEDTWLLMEALHHGYPVMLDWCGSISSVADIGSGTGVIAAHLLSNLGLKTVAVDVSPYAIEASEEALGQRPEALIVYCNAGSCLRRVDLAVFNPPYLPEGDPEEEALVAGLCEGWFRLALTSPEAMREMCINASRAARCGVVAVYSTISPVDLEECLRRQGLRIVLGIEEPFFFERLKAIVAIRGAWS